MPRNRVFRSSENKLYLLSGSNDSATLYSNPGFTDAVDCEAWRSLFGRRDHFTKALKIKYCQLIVPEKLSIYPLNHDEAHHVFSKEHLDDLLPPGQRLLQRASYYNVIYPYAFLRSQAENFPIYPATDSHWSWIGAFSAFQVLMANWRCEVNLHSFVNLPKFLLKYQGDLWEPEYHDIPAETFERASLPDSIRRVYCNSMVGLKESLKAENDAGLHVGSQCIFVNDAAERKETVVLFGSSFSEYRLDASLLTAIFSFYFRTVHFIWSTSLDLNYIARHRPDFVVAEMPERFLTSCPDDSLDIEALSVGKVQHWVEANAGAPASVSVATPEAAPVPAPEEAAPVPAPEAAAGSLSAEKVDYLPDISADWRTS